MAIAGPTTDHYEIKNWAEVHRAVPTEILPDTVDAVPAQLRLMVAEQAKKTAQIRILSWEEFFSKFDELGLTFVYDSESTGYNEILQREEASPYRSRVHSMPKLAN